MAELCVVVDALAEGGPLCDGSARVWGDKVVWDLLDVQLDTVDAPAGVGNMRRRLTDVRRRDSRQEPRGSRSDPVVHRRGLERWPS